MKIVVPSQEIFIPFNGLTGLTNLNGVTWPPNLMAAVAIWSKHIGDEIARGQRNSFARRFLE